jgi:hypothetical protein
MGDRETAGRIDSKSAISPIMAWGWGGIIVEVHCCGKGGG